MLLVHGLANSPEFFSDIGASLAVQGFLVRVMPLLGYGSKPSDLTQSRIENWRGAVRQQLALPSLQVDEVWLGGFSMDANLVTSAATDNHIVQGSLLFSPAFESNFSSLAFAPFLAPVKLR
ncbi:serine aminopeptidase domain-containing protein [Pseudovibrio ascidiaceicola]|uniref:alpha/beta hydrolase n=1 Tax=Pseudovibrio ascidiaceicola TaxID=285279 RepID=UPI000D69894F